MSRDGAIAASAMFALAATLPPCAASLPIRAGWRSCRRSSAIVFEKKDILRHYGTSYTFEPIRFRGNGSQITALAAGDGTKWAT